MAKKFKICHIHPNCSIPDQSTAQETIISNNIWMMCLPRNPLLSLCMLISTITERFLCDFSIESWLILAWINQNPSSYWFSNMQRGSLFGMLWVVIWLNSTTEHRCTGISHSVVNVDFGQTIWTFYLHWLVYGTHFFFINAHECTY